MKKPTVNPSHFAQLVRALDDGRFHKAKDIPMQNRMIRAVCTEYPHVFLSTQQGYKMVEHASDAEIRVAVADLRSRIKHMDRRARSLEKTIELRRQQTLDLAGIRT